MPDRWASGRRAGALLSAIALILLQLPSGPPALAAPAEQLRRYPYLTDVVESYATINWATNTSIGSGQVTYGIVGSEACTAHPVPATPYTETSAFMPITVNGVATRQWKAQLTLQPNTRYCYRVFGGSPPLDLLGNDPSPEFWTQLPTGSTQPYTFAVFGDWGEVLDGTNPWQANLMSRLAASGARFALTTGDNAYPSGSQTNYGDLVQTGPAVSAVFGPQFWALPGRSMPLFPSLGNHGMSSSAAVHPHIGNWPQDRAVSTSNGRNQVDTYCCLNGTNSAEYPSTWYAFDAGIARFYVLSATWANSNVGNADLYKNDFDYHWAPGTAQYEWLQADLAAHPSALKFAFFHFPVYSDEAHETSDPWLQGPAPRLEGLLASHGVDIAFTGHAHIYQRNLDPGDNGVVTYVTGGGGADVQSIGTAGCSPIDAYGRGFSDSSGTGNKCGTGPVPTQRDQVFHYLLVSVNGTQVTVTPTDSLGSTFDVVTYNFLEEPPPPDTEAPTVPANLRATSVTGTQVDLAWDASTDNVGVTAYDLLRDGAPLATVGGSTTAHSDTSVSPGVTYQYAVRARDAAGNASAYSPALSVSTPAPPPGETLTFMPTDDATLRSDKPTTNYGAATTLQADGKPDRDLLMRFTVSGVNGRAVDRATLRLYVVDPSNIGGTFVTTTSTSWTEGTVTWANAPPADGITAGSIGAVSTGLWYELDITSIVAGDGTYSLRATSASNNGVDYASAEGVPAQAPQLVVEISTPLPPDTTAPSVPGNLRTTSVGADHVGLAWDVSVDNVAVTGYELIRDSTPLVTLSGSTTSYLDATVAPEQTYLYAVRATDAAGNVSAYSPDLTVATPAVSTDPVLVGAGDIADCFGNNDEATATLLAGVTGTVFTAGDNAYPMGTAEDFANCYDPSWGQHLARTRPAAGNHDYMTDSGLPYFSYFGTAAGDPTIGYYSYDLDTWHVVVLNSNCSAVGGCQAGSAQEQWLRSDLAASPLQNIAAIWHHPRYSSGPHGSDTEMQALWQALYDYGAELVISGHDHLYERFAPLDPAGNPGSPYGIRQFVVGTGGGALSPTGTPLPNSQAQASAFGVLELTLRSDGYDWRFLSTPQTPYTDAGSTASHPRPPTDTAAPDAPAGLTATPTSSTRVDLSWSGPADNIGVIGYEIERDGVPIASVGAVTAYADTTVIGGQTYTYRVRARDGAGNWSGWSAPASASTPLPPSTLVIDVAEDAYIRPDRATTNFGADPLLLVDAQTEKDFLLKFVVSGTGGQPVTSASLRLYCVNPSNLGGEFYRADQPWSESSVTWNNAPPIVGSSLATLGPVVANTWYEVNLTGFITGDGTYSLRISSPSADGADYTSSEGATGFSPVLVLNLGGP